MALEERLAKQPTAWNHLLRQLVPYQLELRLPQLLQQNRLNLGRSMMQVPSPSLNLAGLFDATTADFSAVSLSKHLYLADVVQIVQVNITAVASLPTGHY